MRVVIADDAALIREGLAMLLRTTGHQVVATVKDGNELIDSVNSYRPDISIVDIRMPPTHTDEGIRAAYELRKRNPTEPILVLSQIVSTRAATDLLTTGEGAVGYLLKDRIGSIEEFLGALNTIASGGQVVDPDVIRQLLQRRTRLESLTPREIDVLALMAQGKTNSSIAQTLKVSNAAIAKHINHIFSKLGVDSDETSHKRVQAVLTYLQH